MLKKRVETWPSIPCPWDGGVTVNDGTRWYGILVLHRRVLTRTQHDMKFSVHPLVLLGSCYDVPGRQGTST